MRRISEVGIIISIVLIGLASAAAQQDPAAQKAALKEIRETAADICYTVEQRGQKNEAQLSGEVQAKVNGAIAKIADLGVKGSGQVGSQEYQGVSQDALAAALKESANCRERVFNKLVDKILPSQTSVTTPPPNLGQVGSVTRQQFRYEAVGSSGPWVYENCFTVSDSRNRFDLITAHLEKTQSLGPGGAAIVSRSLQEICVKAEAPDVHRSFHGGFLVVNEIAPPPQTTLSFQRDTLVPPAESMPEGRSASKNPTAFLNFQGVYYSSELHYGFRISGDRGIATISNSATYKPGDEILRFSSTGPNTFRGEQICTDGRFYPVTGTLSQDGAIDMTIQGCSSARWRMARVND